MRIEGLPRFSSTESTSVSTLPQFDMIKAKQAFTFAKNFLKEHDAKRNSPGLKTAITLSVYNWLNRPGQESVHEKEVTIPAQLEKQMTRLVQIENEAKTKYPQLPSTGLQIELPRRPFEKGTVAEDQQIFDAYKEFSQTVGLPWNKANIVYDLERVLPGIKLPFTIFIEIETPPSYSAQVQSRIVSELIKANALPSLYSSRNPEDIQTHLDPAQMVALHTNSSFLRRRTKLLHQWQTDFDLAEDLLALAFTSPQRIASAAPRFWRSAEKHAQSIGKRSIIGREEQRMHDIVGPSAYRFMIEDQLIKASLMAPVQSNLHALWTHQLRQGIEALHNTYDLTAQYAQDKANKFAALARRKDIVGRLRREITRTAQAIKKDIFTPSSS